MSCAIDSSWLFTSVYLESVALLTTFSSHFDNMMFVMIHNQRYTYEDPTSLGLLGASLRLPWAFLGLLYDFPGTSWGFSTTSLGLLGASLRLLYNFPRASLGDIDDLMYIGYLERLKNHSNMRPT